MNKTSNHPGSSRNNAPVLQQRAASPALQHGMALISGLLLLLVVTILGISMFRSFGLQAKIAGNIREKQRALHSAGAAQEYAEWWVSQTGGGNATVGNECTGVVDVTVGPVQVCKNLIDPKTITTVPWTIGGVQVGYRYPVPGMSTTASNPTGSDLYSQYPMFYIAYVNGVYDKESGTQTNNYRVDATGSGGTSNTVAVVESTYQVQVTYTTQLSKSKFYSLTGP
jgi:type IV pilus assembly protein PilX